MNPHFTEADLKILVGYPKSVPISNVITLPSLEMDKDLSYYLLTNFHLSSLMGLHILPASQLFTVGNYVVTLTLVIKLKLYNLLCFYL